MEQSQLTFVELASMLEKFDTDRGWIGMDPSDLAKSIILEGAELLEHFQWDNSITKKGDVIPCKKIEEISYEAADVMIYLLKFCREMKIDIVDAVLKKIDKIDKKYPIGYNASGNHEEYLKIKKEHRDSVAG